jgi:hypothetical protein
MGKTVFRPADYLDKVSEKWTFVYRIIENGMVQLLLVKMPERIVIAEVRADCEERAKMLMRIKLDSRAEMNRVASDHLRRRGENE